MKKTWLVGIFVFVFSLTLSGMVFADNIGDNGTCADNTSDGYERCNATLHVGDGVSGGQDDYDFHWAVDWKAVDSNTAFFDWGLFTSSGVDSGNDDKIYNPYGAHTLGSATITTCNNKRIYGINCGMDYNLTQDENSDQLVYGAVSIWDPENGYYHGLSVYFKAYQ